MTSQRDYLDMWKSYAQNETGDDSDETLIKNFMTNGQRKRSEILDNIDGTLSKDTFDEEDGVGIREAFNKLNLRHRLGEIHETLRKAGR